MMKIKRLKSEVKKCARLLGEYGVPDILLGIVLGFVIMMAISPQLFTSVRVDARFSDNVLVGEFDLSGFQEENKGGSLVLYGVSWSWEVETNPFAVENLCDDSFLIFDNEDVGGDSLG